MTTTEPQNLDVLREMVRLAERRCEEELHMIERVNQYNLALIAFSAGFLSFLVANDFSKSTVGVIGASLIASFVLSLIAISPRRLKGTLEIIEDVEAIRKRERLLLHDYLLSVAELTDTVAMNVSILVRKKKKITIYAAIFLAVALIGTYILYICQE